MKDHFCVLLIGYLTLTSSAFVFGQDFDSHILFANHTDLGLDAVARITGQEEMVEIGTGIVFPWENGHYHDLDDRIIVTLLNIVFSIGIDHKEEVYLAKFDRFSLSGENDFDLEIDISHQGQLLFTIVTRLNDRPFDLLNPVYYHVRYPDGTNDVDTPYNMLGEPGNAPHRATRELLVGGVNYTLIYGSVEDDNDPTNNLIFSLSESHPETFHFDPDLADASDPTILNMVTYNIGLLMPLGANDQEEVQRVPSIHKSMPHNMDIIVWQEMFETWLVNRIIDSMSVDYPYHTSPHNEEAIPGLTKNGGVLIMSKHPILDEGDYSFEDDGGIDPAGESVFADKGVKYAKIDKHGQIIHVFGSHTSALPEENDAMGRYIRETLIPNRNDIVVMGGDMNTRSYSNNYKRMLDSLRALEPTYLSLTHQQPETRGTTWGFNHYSGGRNDAPRTIDYLFPSEDFKVPLVATNEAMAYRLNIDDPGFWGIYDMGDHQPVYARFEFPQISATVSDSMVCPGDAFEISTTTDLPEYDITWYKDGMLLENETTLTLSRTNIGDDDFGLYRCELTYSYAPDPLINGIIDPFSTPDTYTFPGQKAGYLIKEIIVVRDPEICGIPTALEDQLFQTWEIFPNPASSELTIRPTRQDESSVQRNCRIYNGMGKEIMKFILLGEQIIDISSWPSGVYWLSASNENDHRLRISFIKL